jgi:hypothetical protein
VPSALKTRSKRSGISRGSVTSSAAPEMEMLRTKQFIVLPANSIAPDINTVLRGARLRPQAGRDRQRYRGGSGRPHLYRAGQWRIPRSWQHARPASLDINGHVPGPSFGSVEGDDADRVFVLSVQHISNRRRAAGSRHIGRTPCSAEAAEVIEDEVSILIAAGCN